MIYATGDIGSGNSENSPTGEQSIGSDTLAKAINDARRQNDQSDRDPRRQSGRFGSGFRHHLACGGSRQRKEAGRGFDERCGRFRWLLHRRRRQQDHRPTFDDHRLDRRGRRQAGDARVLRLAGNLKRIRLRGKNAGMFRETEKFSDDERAKFEDWIKTTYYNDFVPKVAKGREKDPASDRLSRTGTCMDRRPGKERGLVDEFGGLDRAIEVAKELAKIPADKGVHRVILPYPHTFIQQLINSNSDNSSTKVEQQRAIAAALPEDARRALRYMALMDRMRNGETMFVMPFDLRVR